ncbi:MULTISPECIES: HEPN domain-containing protein [unclassified Rhizobium]|uniref:HEPN domain-containing protein n=1 Tax=unclassified Rhizobium TaxID=2613769 RepID=UPI0016210DB3|nr:MULTISPECIES: HEPN domain-containing protein [unclassified Rhizobium]MBB3319991.1 putative nucleotidyltransferase/HEPN domain-containing protein [Rhizobium sp. BK181]MBB3545031.1 putative nucleotidyltransferase/HEPN domain-containing protein [Rhizobium sp. BK399]MCS3743751.1 putative nucleotidyltransferase/HEPN domain-containing protein [Rhizobium sp. BK661]MCS4095702.1 putative nucleotidyltransferase/HEPN domain-containing protein [Rhizobium sp. BK176]
MDTILTEGFDAALTLTDHIEHLPDRKRRELARILQILFAEVERFRASKLSARRQTGKILMVLLYGSYARGDWVEDHLSGYRSDYDLLIVVNSNSFAEEQELWEGIEEQLLKEQIAHRIETPVVPIIHTLADVNDQLSRGRPFFVDIARDGVVLYQQPGHSLAQPKPLTAEEQHYEASQYFNEWFELARHSVKLAETSMADGVPRHAAFNLHQATEKSYHSILLTLTLYSPKSHRLKVLRSQAEGIDLRLVEAWPRDSRFSRRCFELLARAYVEARYSSKYTITNEELAWLVERVKVLQTRVETICRERLAL